MHRLDSWIKIDQLDVTCFIISLFTAQHVSNVSLHKDTTPPQPNHTVTPTHMEPEQYNTWNKSTISRKLLKMDVLTFETRWAVNSEIIKHVTSSWSSFIQQLSQLWRVRNSVNTVARVQYKSRRFYPQNWIHVCHHFHVPLIPLSETLTGSGILSRIW